MSSQGTPGQTGYSYPITRDSSDWTRQLKQQRLYTAYSTPDGMDNTDMSPPWLKFGNDIRLSFNQGKFSCVGPTGCTAGAFSGSIPFDSNAVIHYDGIIQVGTDYIQCQATNTFKLYTFTPLVTGVYTISALELSSDPDLFISYPNQHLDTAFIAEHDGGSPTELYHNTNGGSSIITNTFEAGRVYEVMVLQYGGNCFELTVTD
jgi:hypothetical protein